MQIGSGSKKRKLNESSSAKPTSVTGASGSSSSSSSLPPAKKPAVGTASSTKPVPATKPSASAAASASTSKAAGADASFFSAPKAKAKLPSFKKAPVPPKPAGGDMMDASVDPFQEALKMMKVRKESPVVGTPPTNAGTPPTAGAGVAATAGDVGAGSKSGKKKRVTWAPDSKLEAIKWIERAVYDDDPKDVRRRQFRCAWIVANVCFQAVHVNLRDLDRAEGAALHTHVFEEVIDWSEPIGKLHEMPFKIVFSMFYEIQFLICRKYLTSSLADPRARR